MKSQIQMYHDSHRKLADRNEIMMELLYGSNPLTDSELERLIKKDPSRYGAYSGYLGKRN